MEYAWYHLEMKPQDIAVLFKVILLNGGEWSVNDLKESLYISQSEVSKSLKRLIEIGLLSEDKKHVSKREFLDFLFFGIKIAFPARVGRIMKGIPTSHSAPPLNRKIISKSHLVWTHLKGSVKGESVSPLYSGAAEASLKDPKIYELLALVDTLRVGKSREIKIAKKELERKVLT